MEKKNNSLIIIILVIIILGLVGYIVYDKVLSKEVDNNENKSNVVEEQTQEEQPESVDNNRLVENENKYNSIINEYSRAMKDNNFENDTTYETKYPNINYTMMHYYHTYNSVNFNYLYYDINKDNKDELIISNGKESIIAIYTYNGTKAIRLFGETCLGDRCDLEIWDNGIMFFSGSGGAAYHSYEFYKIGLDGYTKESIKKYDVEYKDSDGKTFTVTDRDTNKTVDFKSIDDIISSIKGNAKDVDLSKLDWKEIK